MFTFYVCSGKMATLKTVSRNLPFVKQQLGALTSNTSIFFKLISSLTICCYFLSYSDTMVEMLSVTPGYFLPPTFRIYSALTFCFLELHFWELVIDVLTLVCIRYFVFIISAYKLVIYLYKGSFVRFV